MANKYLEKIAANRAVKYSLNKTMPFLKPVIESSKQGGVSPKKIIDSAKGGMKDAVRKGMEEYVPTGKLTK